MTYENFVKGQLMGVALREGARYGGVDVTLAIAQVLANRVRAGWGDWLQVLTRAPEHLGTIHADTPQVNPRDVAFRLVLQKIDDVYHGISEDEMTEGALYYCELHNVNRDWFRDNILSNPETHPKLAKVGLVDFFG